MLLVFNKAGILALFFGAIGAWVSGFVVWALGFDEGGVRWELISFCAIPGCFDIACRYFDVFRTGTAWLRIVSPFAGAHLFFIPVWILTAALLVLALR